MVKPYSFSFRTQCPISNLDHHPFPITRTNYSIMMPTFLSLLRPWQSHQHPIVIVCANRRGGGRWSQPSNRNMLQLASMLALNLNVFPEPFNSLIAEIARADWNRVRILAGRARKTRRRRRNESVWFVFVLISLVAGVVSWRISELDLFLRALLFCLLGISLFRLCRGNKAIKEWFLGFFFGIVLMASSSSRLGKHDVKFWVQKLRTCSPLAQIALGNRK